MYGGQVASWKNEKGEELLVMSSKVLRFQSINLYFNGHVDE